MNQTVLPQQSPSFVKGIAMAVATVALSTWALGTLWMHSQAADDESALTAPSR
ncbi:MAG TPA: hypothetical protein VGO62_16400 [Myxococcota bacterium]